jgi:hypothetical protein
MRTLELTFWEFLFQVFKEEKAPDLENQAEMARAWFSPPNMIQVDPPRKELYQNLNA